MRQYSKQVRAVGNREAAIGLCGWVYGHKHSSSLGVPHTSVRPVRVILVRSEPWKPWLFEDDLIVEVVDVFPVITAQTVEDLEGHANPREYIIPIHVIPCEDCLKRRM